jgi:hypothetical protein
MGQRTRVKQHRIIPMSVSNPMSPLILPIPILAFTPGFKTKGSTQQKKHKTCKNNGSSTI